MRIIGVDEHLSHGVMLGAGMTIEQGDDGIPRLVSTGGTSATLLAVIDGGGLVINTGDKGDLLIPFTATITGVYLLADAPGNIVVDIWKTPYATFPATATNSITSSTPPTLSSAEKLYNGTLAGWTTTINALDTLRFHVNSVSGITRVTVVMLLTLTPGV